MNMKIGLCWDSSSIIFLLMASNYVDLALTYSYIILTKWNNINLLEKRLRW